MTGLFGRNVLGTQQEGEEQPSGDQTTTPTWAERTPSCQITQRHLAGTDQPAGRHEADAPLALSDGKGTRN